MKNLLQKKHIKYVVWPLVVGGHLVVMKFLGDVIAERNDEKRRADTMSAMFGSLVEFVGTETYTAWEERMSDLYPTDDSIEIVAPIDDVAEEVTDGEESSEEAGTSEEEQGEDQPSDRNEPSEQQN